MLPAERQKKILDLLTVHNVIKMPDLQKELDISIDTLRRDINSLTKQGKVKKIYGGIQLSAPMFGESSMGERMISHLAEKEAIARKCGSFINNGDCIYLDSGSTTYQIAREIKHKENITVITNSIPVIMELIHTEIELIIIGGKIRKNEHSVVTYDYLFNFDQLNIQKAFICAGGITVEKGVSDFNVEETIARKKMIALSHEVYVAADSSKFGKNVMINITPLDNVDYMVTDQLIDASFIKSFENLNTRLVISK